jgi:hypothetical protein
MVNLVEFKTVIWFIFTVDKGNCKNSANQALQRTPYPVPVLMVTEDFNIKLQVKRTAVRRR